MSAPERFRNATGGAASFGVDESTAGGYELTPPPAWRREFYGDVIDRDAVIDRYHADNKRQAEIAAFGARCDGNTARAIGRINTVVIYILFGLVVGIPLGVLGLHAITHAGPTVEGQAVVSDVELTGFGEKARINFEVSGEHNWRYSSFARHFDEASLELAVTTGQFPVTVSYSPITGALTGVQGLEFETVPIKRLLFPVWFGVALLSVLVLVRHFFAREGGPLAALAFVVGVVVAALFGFLLMRSFLWT